jgi:hypothetical protein
MTVSACAPARPRTASRSSFQQGFEGGQQGWRQVGAQVGKARPGARLGRGHVAAVLPDTLAQPGSRRVAIKTRLVNLKQGRVALDHHALCATSSAKGWIAMANRAKPTGRQRTTQTWRLRGTRAGGSAPVPLHRLARGRRTARRPAHLHPAPDEPHGGRSGHERLDWVAVNHWNTDNPHTHIVLRGKDDTGKDLIISRDYIAQGMRERAAELATEWLGPRTELEIQQSLRREVDQERWTRLDRTLQREAQGRSCASGNAGRAPVGHAATRAADRPPATLAAHGLATRVTSPAHGPSTPRPNRFCGRWANVATSCARCSGP